MALLYHKKCLKIFLMMIGGWGQQTYVNVHFFRSFFRSLPLMSLSDCSRSHHDVQTFNLTILLCLLSKCHVTYKISKTNEMYVSSCQSHIKQKIHFTLITVISPWERKGFVKKVGEGSGPKLWKFTIFFSSIEPFPFNLDIYLSW